MQAAPKFLFFFAGYESDCDRSLSALRKKAATSQGIEDIAFEARKKVRWQDTLKYWPNVAKSIVELAFGKGSARGFCRADVQCAEDGEIRRGRKCSRPRDQSLACRKSQPSAIVLFVPKNEFTRAISFFGASVMIVPFDEIHDGEMLLEITLIMYKRMKAIKNVVSNLPLEQKFIFLPYFNFFGGLWPETYPSLWDWTSDFQKETELIHSSLYDSNFQNPVKKQVRGGYLLADKIFFQRDRLHDSAKLGADSRSHGFHLLMAHFRFGVAVQPGFHFDVMRFDGRPIQRQFSDILTGTCSNANETHINISPCDRLL